MKNNRKKLYISIGVILSDCATWEEVGRMGSIHQTKYATFSA